MSEKPTPSFYDPISKADEELLEKIADEVFKAPSPRHAPVKDEQP